MPKTVTDNGAGTAAVPDKGTDLKSENPSPPTKSTITATDTDTTTATKNQHTGISGPDGRYVTTRVPSKGPVN